MQTDTPSDRKRKRQIEGEKEREREGGKYKENKEKYLSNQIPFFNTCLTI
jgi:hypothetical protein